MTISNCARESRPAGKSEKPSSSWLVAIALLLWAIGSAAEPASAQYVFQSINDPNAAPNSLGATPYTAANGINDSGTVVGSYSGANYTIHAFQYASGAYTTIDYPGICSTHNCGTEATGINNSGEVVGDYADDSGCAHVYYSIAGNFYTLADIGNCDTFPEGINNKGVIVGFYFDSSDIKHGFTSNGGATPVPFDCRGASETDAEGINDFGDIVGTFKDSTGSNHAFLFTPATGQCTTLLTPGAAVLVGGTRSINNSGQIVGTYLDSSFHPHTFLLSGGTYITVDPLPLGATSSAGSGINNNAQLVGFFGSSGFLASGPQLVDPVTGDPSTSLIIPGGTVRPLSSLADAQALATGGRAVQGVAAEGVTEVVVRIPANNVGDQFTLTLMNDASTQSSLPNEDGALGKPGDTSFSQSQITVTAVDTSSDPNNPAPFAFAVYRAPLDFARQNPDGSFKSGVCNGVGNTDDQLACRSVSLQIQDLTHNTSNAFPIAILRPLVVLVHGLWGHARDWNNFSPLTVGLNGMDRRFSVGRVSYDAQIGPSIIFSDPLYSGDKLKRVLENSLGFDYNAPRVLEQIAGWIVKFKDGDNPLQIPAAAVQGDIVAHSMGGDIVRTMTRPQSFLSDDTFRQGNMHKVITIDTPHLGSPLAIQLLAPAENQGCLQNLLARFTDFALKNVVLSDGTYVSGGVGDLEGDGSGGSLSLALENMRQVGAAHIPPTALIAGVYQNFASLDNLISYATIIRHWPIGCPNDPLAQQLTSTGWPPLFNNQPNDAIVPENSQLDGLVPSPGSQFFGCVHSQGTEKLGFSGPDVLDSSCVSTTTNIPVPNQVIFLLNTPVTSTTYFNLLNP
jgi:probable HAF family extracellular repeat protein